MQSKINASAAVCWILGIIMLIIGILNLFLVHPVPGLFFVLVSFLMLPLSNQFFRKSFGFMIPLPAKIILAIVLIWFTLGVSDLGDMIDKI